MKTKKYIILKVFFTHLHKLDRHSMKVAQTRPKIISTRRKCESACFKTAPFKILHTTSPEVRPLRAEIIVNFLNHGTVPASVFDQTTSRACENKPRPLRQDSRQRCGKKSSLFINIHTLNCILYKAVNLLSNQYFIIWII